MRDSSATRIMRRMSVTTAACLVALAGCGKKDAPTSPAPVVVDEPAITELHEVRRYMQVDETRPDKPVVAVVLSNTQVTDAGLKHLKGLTELEVLGLGNTRVTDAGLVHVKELTNLMNLYLNDNQVSDAGLEHLKGLTKLYSLSLTNTQVTDAGLDHLKGLTGLRYLKLQGTQVTDRGVKILKESLPNCDIRR